ncbi:peptidase U32 family protein [Treponema endosymbiont of Eucomonympha sp.]|uniref:peptidase U32 family protein n=1 Tax=Treponema endosymbiont of Eucomonympha sp. TaxID=1580831 RepID=UPI000780FB1E|nr:peptidase U32 family protein [Treponema endosymbiont of Eucomonympha sp.]
MAELVAPAGTPEALDAALSEGADAVYLGLKTFNARLRSANFTWAEAEAAAQTLHRFGRKLYITVNAVCEERETEELYRFLAYLERLAPDGIIVQDLGVIRMTNEFFPGLRMHASTQLNAASARAVNLLGKSGVRRAVLARELCAAEIRAVKAGTSAEIEVFVHGSLCVSESGLCLFSSFLGGKSANRGACTQACRRRYTAEGSASYSAGYFFSPNDLELIDRIPALVEAGVDAFKIEGRMKSAEYVGSVTAAYRYMLDHWRGDPKGTLAAGKRMLSSDFGRRKTRFWHDFAPSRYAAGSEAVAEGTLNPAQAGGTGIWLGKLRSVKDGFASLNGGSYEPDVGDTVRLHRKDDSGRTSHKVREVVRDGGAFRMDVPEGFQAGDDVYLLQTKSATKRYVHLLPRDLRRFRARPKREELPVLDITPVGRTELAPFPMGVYIQASTVRDLCAALSASPVRLILELNHETLADLCERGVSLPVSKKQVFLSLDPFCPQSAEAELSERVSYLREAGYANWVVNNPAHFSMLRNAPDGSEGRRAEPDAFLVAGPYLYTFNRWAVSYLENQHIGAFITPLENSRRNLKETFEPPVRSRVMVTVFAYPALFRMRFRLPASYDFLYLSDKEGTQFKALSSDDGSYILSDNPFSVVDAARLLEGEGFSRFLIDLSKTHIEKKSLRQIMSALRRGLALPETSRFNWKEGFYTERASDKAERPSPLKERGGETKAPLPETAANPRAPQTRGIGTKPIRRTPAARKAAPTD